MLIETSILIPSQNGHSSNGFNNEGRFDSNFKTPPDLATPCVIERFNSMVECPCLSPFPKGEKIALRFLTDAAPGHSGMTTDYRERPFRCVAVSSRNHGYKGYYGGTPEEATVAQLMGNTVREQRFYSKK